MIFHKITISIPIYEIDMNYELKKNNIHILSIRSAVRVFSTFFSLWASRLSFRSVLSGGWVFSVVVSCWSCRLGAGHGVCFFCAPFAPARCSSIWVAGRCVWGLFHRP